MRAHAGALIGLSGVFMLTGCVMPGGAPGGHMDGGSTQVSCAESSSVTLDGRGTRYDVDGDCAEVVVRGEDLTVRLAGSTSLSIEGRDNDIESGAGLGAVTIRGDDNNVEARTIASITIAGNDNDIEAATVGSVEIAGDDNGVEAGNDPQPVRLSGEGNTVERR
ncbi:DUF3060 domain-containing protein [Agromyces sp. Marseille-Q5079]|uniref:DUF3060 domain-containing protein n=1 Tax=Agromyces sp. Marseille-Q5079 TaxID=3439059 RepID=UPI003D9C820C